MNKITSEDVVKYLGILKGYSNTEEAHIEADLVLLEFLYYLGYEEIVVAYEAILEKGYT